MKYRLLWAYGRKLPECFRQGLHAVKTRARIPMICEERELPVMSADVNDCAEGVCERDGLMFDRCCDSVLEGPPIGRP